MDVTTGVAFVDDANEMRLAALAQQFIHQVEAVIPSCVPPAIVARMDTAQLAEAALSTAIQLLVIGLPILGPVEVASAMGAAMSPHVGESCDPPSTGRLLAQVFYGSMIETARHYANAPQPVSGTA